MDSIPQKACSRCHRYLPATTEHFATNNSLKSGLSSWCRKCRREYDRAYQRPNEKRDYNRTEKRCSQCKAVKPLKEFPVDSRKPDGHDCRCGKCMYNRKRALRSRSALNLYKREWKQRKRTNEPQAYRVSPESPGFVYVIRSANYYKIGLSKHPETRIQNIQMSSPLPIEIVCVLRANNMLALEQQLHEKFDHARKHGEWFELSDSDVEEIKHMVE